MAFVANVLAPFAPVAALAATAYGAHMLQRGPGDYSAAKRFRAAGRDGNITRYIQGRTNPRGALRFSQGSVRRISRMGVYRRGRYRKSHRRHRHRGYRGAYRPYRLRQYRR